MIKLSDVSYAYPDTDHYTLTNVDLDVPQGEVIGIVGASGAGKTTLAKIISGFIPHVDGGVLSGRIEVDGINLPESTLAIAVSHVGLVIQSPFNQISGAKFTVREELAFGLENQGVEREEMATRVGEVAKLLGIETLLDRSPYALSGGQQQLVAIASMIIMRTPVLVMDEPTSQLDPGGTRMVFDVMSKLRDSGITLVVFEHKVELLREHASTVHVIADHQIVASGPARKVLSDPRLEKWAIGTTRYTRAAALAEEKSLLPKSIELPVSLEDSIDVFKGFKNLKKG
ncbi:MAG: ABC transporter ATP-binding protein [Microbacteriaceae bacterium]|nr:ABC transporter ATP-binding protein [Microbacteriaceae bacterium]